MLIEVFDRVFFTVDRAGRDHNTWRTIHLARVINLPAASFQFTTSLPYGFTHTLPPPSRAPVSHSQQPVSRVLQYSALSGVQRTLSACQMHAQAEWMHASHPCQDVYPR